MNEHQKVLFQPLKDVNAQLFSSSPKLIYSPVWLVCRTKLADSALWLVRLPVNQTLCEGLIDSFGHNEIIYSLEQHKAFFFGWIMLP